ncbi:hypothetical protein A2U01_0041902 [Trifolium medium]|uniref:Uncharacterized protein n=1 Tax=Trifolium medium TaxID=97028 RepID=A0A392QA46_9FABA|nr:hypothetical protein [Trifolium medium]
MASLYLDPIGNEKEKSNVEASEKVTTETLTQEGFEPPKSLNDQVCESDAGKNVETSRTQQTQSDESEGTKSRDEKEDSTTDKIMAKDTAILDVDEYVSKSPVKETVSDGIAKARCGA